jgi:ketosteroid isomerase-like protein
MSQENVEIVRRAAEAAFGRPPDWDTVNALYDPNHELIPLTSRVEGGSAVGAGGWRTWRKRMDETGEWDFETDEIRLAPDERVVIVGRFHLRGDRSGAEVETPLGAVVTVRGGKIVRTETYPSPKEALEAAGLSE